MEDLEKLIQTISMAIASATFGGDKLNDIIEAMKEAGATIDDKTDIILRNTILIIVGGLTEIFLQTLMENDANKDKTAEEKMNGLFMSFTQNTNKVH